ncbi:MAG: hypothetical protein KA792_09785 [Bacteroidales bacterium]|nr:hypothetical protein [Bacteroidales bacterium]
MKILIVCSTVNELQPFLNIFKTSYQSNPLIINFNKVEIHIIISGYGITSTAYYCGKQLQGEQYDLAINAGIAGSFKEEYSTGTVLNVSRDCLADFGSVRNNIFYPAAFFNSEKSTKACDNHFIENNTKIDNKIINNLPKATGITVSTIDHRASVVKKKIKQFNPDIETMEGYAFMFACLNSGIDYLQLRAVSNIISPIHLISDKEENKWDIKKATAKLTLTLKDIINEYK